MAGVSAVATDVSIRCLLASTAERLPHRGRFVGCPRFNSLSLSEYSGTSATAWQRVTNKVSIRCLLASTAEHGRRPPTFTRSVSGFNSLSLSEYSGTWKRAGSVRLVRMFQFAVS